MTDDEFNVAVNSRDYVCLAAEVKRLEAENAEHVARFVRACGTIGGQLGLLQRLSAALVPIVGSDAEITYEWYTPWGMDSGFGEQAEAKAAFATVSLKMEQLREIREAAKAKVEP